MAKNSNEKKIKKTNQGKEVFKRFCKNPLAIVGFIIFFAAVFAAIFAPILTKYDYTTMYGDQIFATPSLEHPFGCDRFGRDLFSRVLYGGRYSIALGVLGTVFSTLLGMVFGSIAGFFGQVADNVVMRIMDILQAIPGILLSMVIATVLGSGMINTVIALSVGAIPGTCRMLRGTILQIRSNEYIEAASSINCSKLRIILKHVIPNTFAPVLVGATMGIGGTIMQAASLSFIGLGVQQPTPEWGALLSDGRNYITLYPHLIIFPGLAIGLVSLAACLLGDGLRDAMDPKLKK
jgi:peptide/nickel transport system permease protein